MPGICDNFLRRASYCSIDLTLIEKLTIPFIGQTRKEVEDKYYVYPFGTIFGTSSYTGGSSTRQYYWGNESETYSDYYIPKTLSSVTILDGNINKGAFYGCTNIKVLLLPDTISTLGSYAFYNCTNLEEIYLPLTLDEYLELRFENYYASPAYASKHL